VVEAVMNVMRFWLRMGVDGLRLDAVPYLIEREGTNCENLPETHTVLKQLRRAMDEEFENRIFLAEANQWPPDVRPYFGDSDECHMAFHFPVMPRMYMALRREDRTPIVEIMKRTPTIPDDCQWAIFLRNHDELTLEMVTDEERDYMYNEYAKERRMRINVGIRRRLAPLLDNGRRQIEMMNALLMSLPGTPIIYYGDEIGMGDNVYLGDRNGVRTPMQWSADRNAGFSEADSAAVFAPVIVDPPYGYQGINVAAQERTATSLLRWMRRLIAVRKQYKAFGRGTWEPLDPHNRRVLVFLRRYADETILCVNNLSRYAQYVELDLGDFKGCVPVELYSMNPFPKIGDLPYLLTLGPHMFVWFRIVRPEDVAAGRGS
ncbi:MAG: alpha-glucosidase C-terminal domain-containing protein, partial [Gemmatimonadaceae bacterium]